MVDANDAREYLQMRYEYINDIANFYQEKLFPLFNINDKNSMFVTLL